MRKITKTILIILLSFSILFQGIVYAQDCKAQAEPLKKMLVKIKQSAPELESKVENNKLKDYRGKERQRSNEHKQQERMLLQLVPFEGTEGIEGIEDLEGIESIESIEGIKESECIEVIEDIQSNECIENIMDLEDKRHEIKNFKKIGKDKLYKVELDQRALLALNEDKDIELIEEDTVIRKLGSISTPDVESVKLPLLDKQGHEGTGIKVAVFDTGIDLGNSDLNVVGGVSFIDGVTSYDDDNGHGTAIAGIIGSLETGTGLVGAGTAPPIQLYAVKVLDSTGIGYYSNIIQGIQWAITNHIDIIVMSFGGAQYSSILREAIVEAVNENILIIAPSGNEGTSYQINYPANFSEVLCVGAVDNLNQIAPFSNTGYEIDLVAPGVGIQTIGLGSNIVTANGTSAAASHIAGVAARLWAIKRNMSSEQLKVLLCKSAYQLGDREIFGWGLVDAEKAYSLKDTDLGVLPEYTYNTIIPIEDAGGEGTTIISAQATVNPDYILPGQTTTIAITFSSAHATGCEVWIKDNNNNTVLSKYLWKSYLPAGTNYYYVPSGIMNSKNSTYTVFFRCVDDIYGQWITEVPVHVEDHSNYRDSSATTIYENSMQQGRINYAWSDVDYFKFTPSASKKFYFKLMNSYNFTMHIYNSAGSLITKYDSEYFNSCIVGAQLSSGQTYYIKIAPPTDATGYYYLDIFRDDHSDTMSGATSVSVGSSTAGQIESPGDVDFFSFYAATAGYYEIRSTGSMDTVGYLYNASGTQLAWDDISGGGGNFKIGRALNPGTYYVKIKEYTLGTGAYGLTITKTNDDHGNDLTSATSISLSTLVSGTINYSGDIDCFKFNTAGRGTYKIEKTGTTSTTLTLCNSSGQEIESTEGANRTLIYPELTATAHPIFIKVSSNTTGQYNIKVTYLPEEVAFPEELIVRFCLGDPNWCEKVGEPINVITGNYYSEDKDLSIATRSVPLEFIRSYNSRFAETSPLGKGWQHNYNTFVTVNPDNSVLVTYGDGHSSLFRLENGVYKPSAGCYELLAKNPEGTYTLTYKNQLDHNYSAAGKLQSIVDKNGNTTTLQYSGSLLSSVTEPGGRSLQFVYGANNYITCVTDPAGRTIEFTYDTKGHQLSFKDSKGGITTYSYDGSGRLTSTLDPLNHYIIRNTYDSEGRVIRQLDSKGQIITIAYDTINCKNTFTDGNGNLTYYYYDDKFRTTKIEYADSKYLAYTYDENYNRLTERDARGNISVYTYDARGNMLTQTDPAPFSCTTTYQYNTKNNPTKVTDRAGHVTNYSYDTQGNLTSLNETRNGEIAQTTYAYNQYGQVLSITNALGKTMQMSYDQYGNTLSTTDPLGNSTVFEYDTIGRMTKKTDQRGASWTYGYDNAGNLTSKIDPLGFTILKSYDAVGNLTGITDQRGYTTSYFYDENDRLVQTKNPQNKSTFITYDANGNKIQIKDLNNETTSFSYDCRNRAISLSDPDNFTETYTLDGNGNVTAKIDKRGKTTSYTFDALNRLISITDSMEGLTLYEYDPLGNKTKEIDPLGHQTNYTYDENSKLLTLVDAQNKTTAYTYDLVGNMVLLTDPDSKTWAYEYDGNNRLLKTIDPLGGSTQTSYDAVGNPLSQTDVNGNTTQYVYDLNSRLIKATDQLGNATTYTYDQAGNKLTITDPQNQTWSYDYDSLNRLIKLTDPLGQDTLSQYDNLSNIISRTDPQGATTYFTYSPRGLLTTVTDALNNTTAYEYDANANLTLVTDAKGNRRTYKYDSLNRLINENNGSGTIKETTYDAVGNKKTFKKADDNIIHYDYDATNRLTTVTYPDNTKVTYTYSALGLRTSMTDPAGTTNYTYDELRRLKTADRNGESVSYNYDPAGNIIGITYPDGTQLAYTYNGLNLPLTANEAGDILQITYDSNGYRSGEALPNGIAVAYQYDRTGRLTSLLHQLEDTTIAKSAYTLDNNGNRLSNSDENGAVTRYTYDLLNQLTNVVYPDGEKVTYTYDAVGNRIETDKIMDTITLLNNIEYTYDYENRLIQAQDDTQTIQYAYDGDGNLISQTITTAGETETHQYFYDYTAGLPRLLVEKIGSETYNYIYAGRLYAKKGADGTLYYHQDGLGSTLAITDAAGQLLNRYSYDAYGNPEIIEETVVNSILFTGEMHDQSGLIYLRARFYDPGTGRFITEDTLFGELADPLSQNLYAYCHNNPVNYVDPSGHDDHDRCAPSIDFYSLDKTTQAALYYFSLCSGESSPFAQVSGISQEAIKYFLKYEGSPFAQDTDITQEDAHCYFLMCYRAYYEANPQIEEQIRENFRMTMIMTFAPAILSKVSNYAGEMWESFKGRFGGTSGLAEGAGNAAKSAVKSLSDVSPNIKNAFGSDTKITTLTKDTTVYRYYGGDSKASSNWFTPNKVNNPASELALPPGNKANLVDTVTLPKGTRVIEGTVAPQPQWGQPGGGYQYYVLP